MRLPRPIIRLAVGLSVLPIGWACGPTDVGDPVVGVHVIVEVTPPPGISADGGVVVAELLDHPGWTGRESITATATGPVTSSLTLSNFSTTPFGAILQTIAEPPPGANLVPDTALVPGVNATGDFSDTVRVALIWR